MEIVLRKLRDAYNGRFQNHHKGELGERYLRQSAKTASAFQKLGEEQNGYDILMVSAQFGLRHRGRSVRRVREILLGNEFGLDTFSIGVMLLTHSDRLKIFDDLSIDCAGDEFALNAGGMLFRAPFWVYRGAELRFGTRDVSVADACRGSVTGFIPPG